MDKINVGHDNILVNDRVDELLSSLNSEYGLEWIKYQHATLNALKKGDIDIFIIPLKWLPLELDPELVIAGLCPRSEVGEALIINEEDLVENKILKIAEESITGYFYNRQAAQLRLLRPDLRLKRIEFNGNDIVKLIEENQLSGLIISHSDLKWRISRTGNYHRIPLHPNELIPEPGDGTLAYLTQADNLRIRRIVNNIHHRDVALCTNVERRLLKRFSEDEKKNVSAFCTRDLLGNFHASASLVKEENEVRNAAFSQSTHLELDLRLYDLLNQKA